MARSDIESVIMWGRNTILGRKSWPAARTNKLERCGPSGTRGLRGCMKWPCAKEPTAAACKRPEPGLVQRASISSTRSSTGAARQTNRDGSSLPDRILHIEVARGRYSKPAELIGQRAQVRADSRPLKGDRRRSDRSLQEPSSGVGLEPDLSAHCLNTGSADEMDAAVARLDQRGQLVLSAAWP
jgi:hypothetical protein